jgi:hypothetical protein
MSSADGVGRVRADAGSPGSSGSDAQLKMPALGFAPLDHRTPGMSRALPRVGSMPVFGHSMLPC